MLRQVKWLTIPLMLLIYAGSSLCISVLPLRRTARRSLRVANTSHFARIGLFLLGVRVLFREKWRHPTSVRNALIVANHLSYLDILIIASRYPAVFITSVELKHTFPAGIFAWFGGSIFVERRSPAGIKREIQDIGRTLCDGFSVVLFPEGTTSNGDTVRPFKNSFFTAAIRTGTPVRPVCIRYLRIDGKRVTGQNRDSVFYYGNVSLLAHAPRMLMRRSVHVECIVLDTIATHPHQSRKELAAQCHDAIATAYQGHMRPRAGQELGRRALPGDRSEGTREKG
jgi:1-acyl-sn-glycerol-3-phosphate acyltransferase